MSEEIKKQDQATDAANAAELAEQDIDQVAGGGPGDGIGGVEVGLRKKPSGTLSAQSTTKLPPSRLGGSSAG